MRFSWSDWEYIDHSRANYRSYWTGAGAAYAPYYPYDKAAVSGYHHDYDDGGWPYTSPVGSFPANGYGLYDMVGNVEELCSDWFGSNYYGSSPGSDPRGHATPAAYVKRGGSWRSNAYSGRVACRGQQDYFATEYEGFRTVVPAHP